MLNYGLNEGRINIFKSIDKSTKKKSYYIEHIKLPAPIFFLSLTGKDTSKRILPIKI